MSKGRVVIVFVFILLGWGCSTTKYVPEGASLLNKIEIENSAKDVSKEQIKYYVRQRENVKIIGFWRFHLGMYNLSGRDDEKGFNKWLRRIGEAPVLYDEILKEKSKEQVALFLNSKGYFNATVSDTVIYTSAKKAKVRYTVNPGERYHLNRVDFKVDDDSLRSIVYSDTINSLLKKGEPFDSDLHDKERERLTRLIRNDGYYDFSKEYIYFMADSSLRNNSINDSLIIVKDQQKFIDGQDTLVNHRKSKIKDVYFLVGFDAKKALENRDDYMSTFDTLMYQDCHILYGEDLKFRAEVLINSNYIFPGQYYNDDQVKRTQDLLSDLQLFRFINIRFKQIEGEYDEHGNHLLDCFIQLSTSKRQGYTFEIEGTNSSGNLGAAGNFKYKHKNFMRGGEVFDMRLRTAMENQTTTENSANNFNTLEVGVDAALTIPKFLIPLKVESFRKKYNPTTNFSTAYNYQRRPDYTRILVNGRLGYDWRSSRLVSHFFAPFDLSLVNVPVIDDDFWNNIKDTYLRYSYEDHLISSMSYSYIYNEQVIAKSSDYWYFQTNLETSGNILNAAVSAFNTTGNKGYHEIFGIRYAQYVKADIDIRYHFRMNRINSFAYRLFAGAAYPYGNSQAMPFIKQYFSGGANSLRAWPVRGLGPGSFKDEVSTYYNQTADIKLEANAEYRFKLFWLLEGAFFVDAGNIWTIKPSGDESFDEQGLFKVNNFYKQIAIGVGTGARLDFNYFVFRLDMGVKARDPSLPSGERWILGTRSLTWSDTAFNFAIGYPF
ncbi:BamA/TamA family outer membrane protein [Carboxylicivirga sp. N1Y90]|uniref:translocation and assembly module lipoprotein TamL n=1 Tax=Carboxylicivirga fragile TaxID=3417571 RepID=UPI003D34D219|nr:BamA/TamA family outer membrane protein [Marinilabiliaceae bacterium N1Y90]